MKIKSKTTLIIGLIVVLLLNTSFVVANEKYFYKFTYKKMDKYSSYMNDEKGLNINIVKPKEGHLYILDRDIVSLPSGRTRIFGKITIEIDAFDNISKIDYVDLFVDDELKVSLHGPYYEWMLDEPLFSKHTIKAIAYNIAGDNASNEIDVKISCFGRLPNAPLSSEIGIANQSNTDGYNYFKNKDGVGDFVYNQLWYFNFLDDKGTSDTSDDIAGVAAYGLANPENLLTGGAVTNSFGMIIRDSSEGESFPIFSEEYDPTIPGNFYASESFEPDEGPELQNPGGTIDVISPNYYHIMGQVIKEDKEIRWDLYYKRSIGQPWLPWVKWSVPKTLGIFPAWINYHMQMANAVVNGTFYVRDSVNEVTYELVDARGYHDGFFSEFVFSIFEWNWLDFKQDNLSVHLLYPHAPVYSCQDGWETCTPGNLRVVYNNSIEEREYNFYRRCDLDKNEIFISYGDMAVDPKYPDVEYPTKAYITAVDEDGNTLELQWSLSRYMIVYFDVPAPFYDTVTFEIIADFSGTFYEESTNTYVPISGPGWSDWSGQAFPE
ncbi:MAG: hypothetical protein A3K77_01030 [Euryarchaeota archaeon RBG_13_31_8]|nr:MAG: hypothetical protein A3K77_01030 [Euryarchaeota archaeon RBG_13_31_8]